MRAVEQADHAAAANGILVLQHADCEPPGAYEDELIARGIPLRRVAADRDELPDWRGFAGIVAMGGSMGAYEDALHPWLSAEKRLIAQAVRAGTPYWGVCLGAQLLAASLGARVQPGPATELGVLSVSLTDAAPKDPVFASAPTRFATLQWRSEEHTSELQSQSNLVCRLLLEKKKKKTIAKAN